MSTTIHISGLNDAACLLATPGFVRPLAGRHAGSLLTGWLGVSQVGLAHCAHPLGNNNQFHGVSSNPKVSGLPWREQADVRLGSAPRCGPTSQSRAAPARGGTTGKMPMISGMFAIPGYPLKAGQLGVGHVR